MTDQTLSPKKLHRYPYQIGLFIVAGLSAALQLLIILDCIFTVLDYELDAVSSVMSTCSEVAAGMYGIILTGYIFFADRFQDTSRDDESLYDIVQALLLRYNHMAGALSLLCLISIIMGEGIVLYGSNDLLPDWLYRFWVDETLLLFFVTFNVIMYFVICVMDPQKVSRISSQKKKKLSEDPDSGNAQEFMADWRAIEELLQRQLEKLVDSVRFVPGTGKGNKPGTIRMLETLRNYGRISNHLWQKLNKLRLYYNLAIHDPNPTVSKEMCQMAKDVLAELQANLE